MLKQLSMMFSLGLAALLLTPAASAAYGQSICKQEGYKCVKVKKGDSWQKLFPNSAQRDLVMRLNRVNTQLRPGKVIAVPKDLAKLSIIDIAPFPAEIQSPRRSTVVVDQKQLAWGAYSADGLLLKWGPMSAGKEWCADIKEKCHTPAGKYVTFRKEGEECKSSQFPVEKEGGGAPMPYCVFFNGGIAFHGSDTVPGYNASHGCVRMYTEDARWLNTEFVELGRTQVLVDTQLPKAKPASSAPASAWNNQAGYRAGGIDSFAWH
ncbi:MAG: L,D-transpeptidase [Gammaproteobacteria bacterium]|nr:L,D-transpeptidase [Gammaproteobacteria bacterium]